MLERALRGQDAKGLSARRGAGALRPAGGGARAAGEARGADAAACATAPSATGPTTCRSSRRSSRMRASGYSEALGFTVYDTLIYKRHLERLVREEVGVMMERVAGEMDTDAGGGPARAGGRADARPGRRAAREAAGRGAAGAPRGAAVLGARWTCRSPPRPRPTTTSCSDLYALVVEEGGAFPREPPADEADVPGGVDRGQDRRVRRSLGGRARRLVSPAAELRRPRGAHRQRGLHGRPRASGAAGSERRSSSTLWTKPAGSGSTR